MNERDYERGAFDLAERFNDLTPDGKKRVVSIIAHENQARAAIDKGDWSLFALIVALRAEHGLPALSDI